MDYFLVTDIYIKLFLLTLFYQEIALPEDHNSEFLKFTRKGDILDKFKVTTTLAGKITMQRSITITENFPRSQLGER